MSADRVFLLLLLIFIIIMQYYRNLSPNFMRTFRQLSSSISTENSRNEISGQNIPYEIRKGRRFRFSVRSVPPIKSRFDYPWTTFKRKQTVGLEDSNGRVLLSPNRVTVGDGLGHALSIHHAEITTAWRLGVTYSHRTGKYASLTEPYNESLSGRFDYKPEFQNAAAIENFFGWGSREIPREAIQRSICPLSKQNLGPEVCTVCLEPDRIARKMEIFSKANNHSKFIRIDQIVEIPLNLTYYWMPGERDLELYRQYFLQKHSLPYTAFVMPTELCSHCPAYSKYSEESYNFYFNKYWDTHGTDGFLKQKYDRIDADNSFEAFYRQYTSSEKIANAIPRPKLKRLKESEIYIAVHARRGDFFQVGRPMVPLLSFVHVIQQMISIIKEEKDDVFSAMKISIAFYSEGQAKVNRSVGHNIHAMNSDFVDIDGSKVSRKQIEDQLRNESDYLRNISRDIKLKIHMRISEATILCLHEMIAADIFIGSESGLSQQLVSSLNRGALQLLPSVKHDVSDRQVQFNATTGEIPYFERQHAMSLWNAFVHANIASARRALGK